jgi:hypothetical protein
MGPIQPAALLVPLLYRLHLLRHVCCTAGKHAILARQHNFSSASVTSVRLRSLAFRGTVWPQSHKLEGKEASGREVRNLRLVPV